MFQRALFNCVFQKITWHFCFFQQTSDVSLPQILTLAINKQGVILIDPNTKVTSHLLSINIHHTKEEQCIFYFYVHVIRPDLIMPFPTFITSGKSLGTWDLNSNLEAD